MLKGKKLAFLVFCSGVGGRGGSPYIYIFTIRICVCILFFFSKCRLTKSLCTEPKPVSEFKNNQFKEKAQANELDEQQS